jgi:hypothetical protein
MKEISLMANDGYVKIFPDHELIEIKSANFYVKGNISIDRQILEGIKIELKKCISCEHNQYDKVLLVSKDKLLGIELRCGGWKNTVLLIGEYRENEEDGNMLEFEFILEKKEIEKAISEIEILI